MEIKKKQRPFMEDMIRLLERIYYAENNLLTNKTKAGISETRFNYLLDYLKYKKFIEIHKNENKTHLLLTDFGADFLINYRRQLNQEKFNEIIAFTGCILAITSIYIFLKNMIVDIPPVINGILITLVIISLGPLVAFVIHTLFRRKI